MYVTIVFNLDEHALVLALTFFKNLIKDHHTLYNFFKKSVLGLMHAHHTKV